MLGVGAALTPLAVGACSSFNGCEKPDASTGEAASEKHFVTKNGERYEVDEDGTVVGAADESCRFSKNDVSTVTDPQHESPSSPEPNPGEGTKSNEDAFIDIHGIRIKVRGEYRKDCKGNIGVDGMPMDMPRESVLTRSQATTLYEAAERVSGSCRVPAFMVAAMSYRENTAMSDSSAMNHRDGAMQVESDGRKRFQPQGSGGARNPAVSVVTAVNYLRDLAYRYDLDYTNADHRLAAYAMYNGGEGALRRPGIPAWDYAFDARAHEDRRTWWDGDGRDRTAAFDLDHVDSEAREETYRPNAAVVSGGGLGLVA
jgi:hypothetical protein